jgi:hypothetical protein
MKNDVPDKDEVENEGEVEEDEGDREAMHQSLQTYINMLQVHNDADSEAAPLPEPTSSKYSRSVRSSLLFFNPQT